MRHERLLANRLIRAIWLASGTTDSQLGLPVVGLHFFVFIMKRRGPGIYQNLVSLDECLCACHCSNFIIKLYNL